jgi:P4 family phage/plasmid primase-like protien
MPLSLESGISESMRDLLIKKIAAKTGTSVTSINKDIKTAAAPKYQDPATPPTEGEPVVAAAPDMAQPHTAAAQTALATLSAGGVPPAFCFNTWLRWDGSHWAAGETAVEIKRQAHRALYNQGTHATASTVRSVVETMQLMAEVSPAAFEPDVEQIKVFAANGVLHFTKDGWKVEPPAPNNRNLAVIGVNYDPQAPEPVHWLRFLAQATTSEQARRTLAVTIIYAAARCRPWLRKAIYIYGPTRSGKSTILNAIQGILGKSNCSALNMRQLGSRFGGSRLVGRLANISNETVSRDTIQDDIFKSLVSGETVEVEAKHGAHTAFDNTTKLIFAANGFPRVEDESDATLDRLAIISLPWSMRAEDMDTRLGAKIARELPGVLNWAMQIFEEEYRKDLCVSAMRLDQAAEQVRASWQETNHPATRWARERTTEVYDNNLPIDAAYADYRLWCRENGHKEANKIHFSRQAGKKLNRGRVDHQNCWINTKLLPLGHENFRALA